MSITEYNTAHREKRISLSVIAILRNMWVEKKKEKNIGHSWQCTTELPPVL